MNYEAECVTTHERGQGEVEITWVVPYSWSKPVPATYWSPAEGGAELDGEVYPCEVTYYPSLGEPFTIDRIQEGSLLALHLMGEYGIPSQDDMCDAVNENEEGRANYR